MVIHFIDFDSFSSDTFGQIEQIPNCLGTLQLIVKLLLFFNVSNGKYCSFIKNPWYARIKKIVSNDRSRELVILFKVFPNGLILVETSRIWVSNISNFLVASSICWFNSKTFSDVSTHTSPLVSHSLLVVHWPLPVIVSILSKYFQSSDVWLGIEVRFVVDFSTFKKMIFTDFFNKIVDRQPIEVVVYR